MAVDHRTALYRQLHKQHTADEPQRIYAAERVLRLVYDKIKVGSVLDVGCGRGLWLAVAAELGATETIGIEGPWIEVGEHLSAVAAETFVTSLVRHGDFILFSAAIPFQPGTGHINCQFPDYWASLFAKQRYYPVDFIRRVIWNDRSMHVWIRQNVLAFVSPEFLLRNPWARETASSSGPLSIVHPELFTALNKARLGKDG